MKQNDGYLHWKKGEKKLVGFFNLAEFACRCQYPDCVEQKISLSLIDKLNSVRQECGTPISIHSGLRCNKRQKDLAASGAETAVGISQHELGNAADIASSGMHDLLQSVKKHFLAVGVANTFLHVDLRDDKPRYWTYRT